MTYRVNAAAAALLGEVPQLLDDPRTKVLTDQFKGKTFLCKLPGGQLFYESKLALDADGSPTFHKQDKTGQAKTAVLDKDGKSLDADTVNYFVLPGGFYFRHGIRKGDIGVVIYGDKLAYACFGDVGPSASLGEGSIALHRALGHETIVKGRLKNVGLAGGVITVVFPGSGNGRGVTNEEAEKIGLPLLQRLKMSVTTEALRKRYEQAPPTRPGHSLRP